MSSRADRDDTISALADGQLRGAEFARAVEHVSASAQARATWQAYHLIGDVLRSPELAPLPSSAGFIERLQASLAHEPIQPLAIHSVADAGDLTGAESTFGAQTAPANASTFRWKLVAGLASLAAVAAVSWSVTGGGSGPPRAQGELAQVTPATPPQMVLAGNERQAMIRDPRLDELLAAHRQAGGASALQMSTGFLRNATFEGPAR
ncbi:MAG: sigma-E factor negative regulatory protein [Ramlibacter sp.]|nr:sigma-E factor negative regulatory protein [Ramlibacter sp.]